jgi:hypothetical protein
MIADKAVQEYNALQELDSNKYNALQQASKMIADKAVQEYNALQESNKNIIIDLQNQLSTSNNNLRMITEENSGISNSAYQLLKINDEKAYNELQKKYIQVVATNKKNAALLAKLLGKDTTKIDTNKNNSKKSKKDKTKTLQIDTNKNDSKKSKTKTLQINTNKNNSKKSKKI